MRTKTIIRNGLPLHIVIAGLVAQFIYRLMLHASLIVAWLHAFIGG